ncbi:MAG: XRE family transcriptional regulator, partial [Terriglobia bacterium]
DADREQEERIANAAASDFCVAKAELENFSARVQPLFSEQRIVLFAQRLQTHPGIVIGQLHNALNRHDLLRRHVVKIAHIVRASTAADGWGSQESI